MARIAGRRRLVLREPVLRTMADVFFRLGRTKFNSDWLSLAFGNGFRYDAATTQESLGWRPRHTAAQAYGDLVRVAAKRVTLKDHLARKVDRIGGVRYAGPRGGVA